MKTRDNITLSEWNELTNEQKEVLRVWAVKQGYELDLVPSNSDSFDPVCDYAALLTVDQMIVFLQEHNRKVFTKGEKQGDSKLLWKKLVKYLR